MDEMFDTIHQQNLADMIKAHIFKFPRSLRDSTLIDLQHFERSPWFPQIFRRAVDEFGGGFTVSERKVEIDNPIGVIPAVLARYLELVEEAVPTPMQMGTSDAMEYLSRKLTAGGHPIGIWGVKKYIEDGKVPYEMVGKTRVYTKAALDQYIVEYLANPPRTGPKGPHKKKQDTF